MAVIGIEIQIVPALRRGSPELDNANCYLLFCQQDMCLPATRRLRQSEKPTANTPVTVTPETRAACFVSPGDAPGKGGWSGMLLRSPVTRRRSVLPCPVQVSRSHGNACRTCSHTARNHPYRLSLELRLVSVVHRRIANAEHFLAGEPRTIVVV